MTVQSSPVGWILILLHLALGFLTLALAVDDGFAKGKVFFASEGWRYGLGAIGLYLSFRAARAVVRTVNHTPVELSAEQHKRSKRLGLLQQLIGAAFVLACYVEWIREHSVAFTSWAKPVYIVGGFYLFVMGTVSKFDGYRMRQLQHARARARGEQVAPYLSSDE